MAEFEHHEHEFPPEYDKESKVLILGSFPSVKSREQGFYYGHPQNRFWRLLARLTGMREPRSVEEKKILLHNNHIALWDVIESCDIKGSSDSSIRNVKVNDIGRILRESRIERIYANGKLAQKLYDRYVLPKTGVEVIVLPSTSPANAACREEQLVEIWSKLLEVL